jgi:hypothetical protein
MVMIAENKRILIVDDNPSIHDDFRKILAPASSRTGELSAAEAVLFGQAQPTNVRKQFEIDSAFQGEEALEKTRAALHEGGRMRWRLWMCACRRAGTAWRRSRGSGESRLTSRSSLHRVFGLLLARHRASRGLAAQHGRAEEAVR